jgi:hypothetical protein
MQGFKRSCIPHHDVRTTALHVIGGVEEHRIYGATLGFNTNDSGFPSFLLVEARSLLPFGTNDRRFSAKATDCISEQHEVFRVASAGVDVLGSFTRSVQLISFFICVERVKELS